MIYKVEINFKKGPSFSTEIDAMSEATAKEAAIRFAKNWGFIYPVKKVVVR